MSNQAHLTSLYEYRDNLLAKLKSVDPAELGGLPNSGGPVGVDHMGYRRQLMDELRTVQEQIDALEARGVTLSGEEPGALWSETLGGV